MAIYFSNNIQLYFYVYSALLAVFEFKMTLFNIIYFRFILKNIKRSMGTLRYNVKVFNRLNISSGKHEIVESVNAYKDSCWQETRNPMHMTAMTLAARFER